EFAPHTEWTIEAAPSRPELANLFLRDEPSLTCEISGPDLDVAEAAATRLLDAATPLLARSPHPLRLQQAELEPRYALALDTGAVWRHGLRTDDVLRAVQAQTSGYEAMRMRRFDAEDPVVIRTADAVPTAEASLVVGGRTFPLRDLFQVRTELAPAELLRVNQSRVATLRWDGPLQDVGAVRSALDRA